MEAKLPTHIVTIRVQGQTLAVRFHSLSLKRGRKNRQESILCEIRRDGHGIPYSGIALKSPSETDDLKMAMKLSLYRAMDQVTIQMYRERNDFIELLLNYGHKMGIDTIPMRSRAKIETGKIIDKFDTMRHLAWSALREELLPPKRKQELKKYLELKHNGKKTDG